MSVYFISCGGYIKVGFSDDPAKRTKNLFKSTSRYSAPRSSFEARGTQVLIGCIEGDKTSEYWLHQALDAYAVGCEWFVDEPALREYLAALTDDHGDEFEKLPRPVGSAWSTVDPSERGGHNVSAFEGIAARRGIRLTGSSIFDPDLNAAIRLPSGELA